MHATAAIQLFTSLATLACYVCIPLLLWVCYRRSRNPGFVWLAVALLVWPALCWGMNAFVGNAVDDVVAGEAPGRFPFSLMAGPSPSMTRGDFVMLYQSMTMLVTAGLITIALFVMARSLRTSLKS